MSKVVLLWAFAALCLAMGASAQQALEMVWSFPSAQPCNTPTLWHDELFDVTKSTPERAAKLAMFKSSWGHLSTWVYVACADGSLSALNTTTSAVGWSIQLNGGSIVTDPAISHDGYIYVGTSQGMVYKVDTIGGVVEWNYTSSRGIVQQSPISLGGSALVFGNEAGRTIWLDLATGQQLHVATGSTIADPTPIIYEGFVAHSDLMQVWVDDVLTSNLLYKFTHGTGTFHRVLGLGSNFYAPNDGGNIYVFQCATGSLVAKIPCQTAKPLAYADGSIIAVTQGGNVTAYSESTQAQVWETTGNQFTSPATASGTVPSIGVVYVGSGSGLVALNTTDGSTVAVFKTNTAITRAPGVQYGVGDIYISTQQGVFRLRGPRV